jgi:VWFA-related protein
MQSALVRVFLLTLCVAVYGNAGSGGALTSARSQQKPRPATATKVPSPRPSPAPQRQEVQSNKSAHLIQVPVFVKNSAGHYITDLAHNEFEIFEDGVKQNVALLTPMTAPTSVVLLLDTSISTQGKLGEIRRAAQVFADQLQKSDRIKLITFDDQIREMNEFTTDRVVIKTAIRNAESGYNTKVYDAINVALESLREVDGRKAIVIFSDGVDYRSDYASSESTLRSLEQDGVLVYPIRFSTRAAAERLAREQAGQGANLPTAEVVRSTSGSPEPLPGDSPSPTSKSEPRTGPLGLPSPDEIFRRRRDSGRDRDRYPPTGRPPAGEVGSDLPAGRARVPVKSEKRPVDTVGVMLDRLYTTADTYLQALADKSGGQLLQADTVGSLPDAFSEVANELRAQYLLGYAPSIKAHDDQYHTIKIVSSRPGMIIRARAGYRPRQVGR